MTIRVFIGVLLAAVGLGLLAVALTFGTIDPCGIVRAQVREEASREGGGFGRFLASALPDSVIDGLVAARYGQLSPGRCLILAVGGGRAIRPAPQATPSEPSPPVQSQIVQQNGAPPLDSPAALQQADRDAAFAVSECRNKRISGEIKGYVASAECANPRFTAAFQKAGYRYMDLIYLIEAKRLEIAEKLDRGQITEIEGQLENTQFISEIADRERQRDRGQR